MGNKIKLRKITKSDLKYFLKWWKDKELIRLTSGVYEKSEKVLTGYFLNFFKNNRNHHFILLLNNKVIGHLSLSHKNNKISELHIIIGEEKYRGKGYGLKAIEEATKIAFNKLGYKQIYLEVRPNNRHAIDTYKKSGFIAVGFKKYPNNKFQPLVLKMILSKNDLA